MRCPNGPAFWAENVGQRSLCYIICEQERSKGIMCTLKKTSTETVHYHVFLRTGDKKGLPTDTSRTCWRRVVLRNSVHEVFILVINRNKKSVQVTVLRCQRSNFWLLWENLHYVFRNDIGERESAREAAMASSLDLTGFLTKALKEVLEIQCERPGNGRVRNALRKRIRVSRHVFMETLRYLYRHIRSLLQ